jgi:hypothetical protein
MSQLLFLDTERIRLSLFPQHSGHEQLKGPFSVIFVEPRNDTAEQVLVDKSFANI